MLTVKLAKAAVPLVRRAVAINRPCMVMPCRFDHHGGVPHDYKHPTMDELPIPCGSWQENYDNDQRKYNIHLIFGTGFFLISLISCYYAGIFDFYLFAPEKPASRESMQH